MKSNHDTLFVGKYTEVFEDETFCDFLIEEFNVLEEDQKTWNRQSQGQEKHQVHDFSWTFNKTFDFSRNFNNGRPWRPWQYLTDALQQCFESYTSEYSVLKQVSLNCSLYKMQRIPSGGGYLFYHSERDSTDLFVLRELFFIFYLNTVELEYGGETEFFYQRQRIQPVKNTCIIGPANYTGMHRGGLLLGDNLSKYIVTGWFTRG